MAAYSQEVEADRKASRWISLTEGGVLAGNSDNENATPFVFHSSVNYAIIPRLSAGLGVGVEFLKETHLPVTANVMYQYGRREGAISPFVRLQAGYMIPVESKMSANYYNPYLSNSSYYAYYSVSSEEMKARGGLLVNPSVGVIFGTKHGYGISLAAGYRYHRLNYTGSNAYRVHLESNRLSLALGLIF
jgi:hypothetical protein